MNETGNEFVTYKRIRSALSLDADEKKLGKKICAPFKFISVYVLLFSFPFYRNELAKNRLEPKWIHDIHYASRYA